MKKMIVLSALSFAIVGCNKKQIPEAYTPEMASFSNEFDFDPLRGQVKTFSQTLKNEKGQTLKYVNATLSHEGCFDSLELHDLENKGEAKLVLNANYYLDARTQEKRIELQGKCQLARVLTQGGAAFNIDERGFVISARNPDHFTEYSYDQEGYPVGKMVTTGKAVFKVAIMPGQDEKLNYTATSSLNNKTLTVIVQQCTYDKRFNPRSCKLDIIDKSVEPPSSKRYSINNSISYY